MSIQKKQGLQIIPAVLAVFFSIASAEAGMFEISLGGSFNHSTYTDGNFSWSRRWGATFGYHLSEFSEIELAFQDIVDRTKIEGYEDTTFHDEIYGANWVQSLFGKNSEFQPYVKAGVGQLNRSASGTYASGGSPPIIFDSLTGILGAGLRIHLVRGFAIRAEGTTYLTGANINTWRDNFALTVGLSLLF